MFKSCCTVLAIAVLLAACTVSGPRVKVEPPRVEMEPVVVETGVGHPHCPPGHAMKGWC